MHWLHFLFAKEAKESADVDEVNEARIEFLVSIDVPEWIKPMTVVQMSVAAHHLAVNGFCVLLKLLWKSGGLAEPLASGKLRKWCIEVSWSRCNWRTVSRSGSRVGC